MVHSFLNKFAAKPCKHFPPHLFNVSTLRCETENAHCARAASATELLNKLQKLFHKLTVASKFARFESIWLQIATGGVQYKTRITDLDWRCHWQMAAAMTTWSSLAQLFRFVHISDACFVHFLLQYFQHAVISWIHISGEFRGHNLDGINSGVFFI